MNLRIEEFQESLMQENLFHKLSQFSHIILFGAGKSGDYFLKLLKQQGMDSSCFCDNYKEKQGKEREGISILSFEDAIDKYPHAAICITSVFAQEIYRQITEYNSNLVKQVFFVLNTMNWETNRDIVTSDEKKWIMENRKELEEVYNLFEDSISKDTMEGILNYRLTRNSDYIANIVCNQETYFDHDIFPAAARKQFKNYIDGGSFTGDTIQKYIEFIEPDLFESAICFEPDETASNYLRGYLCKMQIDNVQIRKSALWDKTGYTEFYESGAGGGSVCKHEGNVRYIRTEALDEIAINKVDLVKLDLEGAEYNALVGMKNIIQTQNPALAVCVYHKQDDLIQIPKFIKMLNADYSLYLRHYMYVPYETVLYALRKE